MLSGREYHRPPADPRARFSSERRRVRRRRRSDIGGGGGGAATGGGGGGGAPPPAPPGRPRSPALGPRFRGACVEPPPNLRAQRRPALPFRRPAWTRRNVGPGLVPCPDSKGFRGASSRGHREDRLCLDAEAPERR